MKYFFFAMLLFHFTQIHGQEKFKPQTTIGITQKLNIPLVYFDPIITQTVKFGYHGGFVFRHISQPGLGLQMELNFSQRGWNGSVPDSISSQNTIVSFTSYKKNLNYIEFPFMTNITFGKKSAKFLINVGAMLSYLIYQKQEGDLSDDQLGAYDQLERIDNNFDFGICIGAGLSRKTSIGIFQFEARYNQSLTNIFSNTPDDIFSHSKAIVIGAGVTYLFEIKI